MKSSALRREIPASLRYRLSVIVITLLSFAAVSLGQDDHATINRSLIPAEAADINKFVPAGWKIEEQLKSDLNADGTPDFLLKLIENKPAKDKDDRTIDRGRALVVLLARAGGKLALAGVADKLLQCTGCGGAFYGVSEAPANVAIENGVIVVDQDHGARDLTNMTFRFRFDPVSQKFLLIGFDYADADRLTAMVNSESTNYLTGVRKTTRAKGERDVTNTTRIPIKKVFLDQVDYEQFEQDADERLSH